MKYALKSLRLSGLSLICLAVSAWAAGPTTVLLEDHTHVKLPQKALAHVSILGERIQAVRGEQGCYKSQFDNKAGAWFVQVLQACAHKPFSAFVETERGTSYLLEFVPTEGAEQRIVLVPNGDRSKAAHWEKSGRYEQRLLALIQGMWSHKPPEGYRFVMPERIIRQSLGTMAYLYKMAELQGGAWKGIVYTVRSRRRCALHLSERFFKARGVRAVALADTHVPPQGTTTVFVIQEGRR